MRNKKRKSTINKQKRSTVPLRQALDKELWEALSKEARIEGLTVSDIFEAILMTNIDKYTVAPMPESFQYRTMSIKRATSDKITEMARSLKVPKAEIVRQVFEIALRK